MPASPKERGFEEDRGLHMILNCSKHSEVRNCWKKIAASLPLRSARSVYYRANALHRKSENRWTGEEVNALKRLQAEHGNNWKKISEILGKNRIHVKDKWHKIKIRLTNSGDNRLDQQKLYICNSSHGTLDAEDPQH